MIPIGQDVVLLTSARGFAGTIPAGTRGKVTHAYKNGWCQVEFPIEHYVDVARVYGGYLRIVETEDIPEGEAR